MSQVELNDGEASPVLILGIDPGTTGAKIAFLKAHEVYKGDKLDFVLKSEDKIHVLEGFPGHRQAYVSTLPTSLIYNKTGQLIKWGHEAVNFQEKQAFDPEQLVTNWKLKLLEGSRQDVLEAASRRLGKLPGDFVTDFFAAVTNYLFKEPRSCLLNHFGSNDLRQFRFIDVVITLPPGWPHKEHSIFSDAAKKALVKIPNVRIITVSETECALRSWMSQEGQHLTMKDGEVVILLDLGGGTACLSAFYYDAATGRWVHLESYSLPAGSELVTAAFERDFLGRFRQTGLPETTEVLYRARRAFDLRKMAVGDVDEDKFWECPANGLKRDQPNKFTDGGMLFTSERLRSFFEPLQDEILTKLREMTTRLCQTYRKPKYCVLAGAYARNILFLEQLHAANDSYMQMRIFSPQDTAKLVAIGACLTRVEGDCRLVSGSRISVGIMTFIKWKDAKKKCPAGHRFLLEGDRHTLWCRVITWVIKKGDEVDPEKAIIDHDKTRLRRRHIHSQDSFIFNETIFTSEAHPGEVEYTVLMYSSDDSGQKNKQDFTERYGMPLNIHEFTLDLSDKPLMEKDGSKVVMKNSSFKHDRFGKYFEYKYYMNLSQTDCRISLEAFSAKGRTRRMLLQHSISAFEVKSAELQDEQRFAEQLLQRAIANEASGESIDAGPSSVGSRFLQIRDSDCLSPASRGRSSRRNQKKGRSINGFPIAPVTEENLCQQSRHNDTSIPSVFNNAGLFARNDMERPDEDSLQATGSAIGSQSDLWDVAMAAMQEINQRMDRSSSEAQEAPTPKRARRADTTGEHSGSLSLSIPSIDLRAPGETSSGFASPTAESDTSEYQHSKRPVKKNPASSLKDSVIKSKKKGSSWGIRKKRI